MDSTDTSSEMGTWSFWQKIRRRKLKNYLFLDKKLQFNIALLLTVIGTVNVFYFSILFYFYSQESLFRLAQWIPDYVLDEVLKEQLKLWTRTVVFGLTFEIVLVMLLGLFFSHRIAGPLFAMGRQLREVARGGIPNPVRLRRNDLLTQFAEDLNEAFTTLNAQRAELEAAAHELEAGNVDSAKSRLKKITASVSAPEPS